MHSRQTYVLATARAIQGFLDANNDVLAAVNDSGARKSLDELVGELTVQAVDQDAGRVTSRGETSLQASLRKTLREVHMKRIATIARARLRDVPEMRSFMLPGPKTPSLKLVAMAGGMADAASKHSAVFIERGLPQDFIAQLTNTAAALNQSLDTRAKSYGRATGATSAIGALAREAAAVIRELDALVRPLILRDERLLGEWRTTSRIRRKTGPSAGSTAAAVSTAPTTVEAIGSEEPAA